MACSYAALSKPTNDTVTLGIASCDAPLQKVWLRMVGDFDNDQVHYEFSLNGEHYRPLGREMPLSYQAHHLPRFTPCALRLQSQGQEGRLR